MDWKMLAVLTVFFIGGAAFGLWLTIKVYNSTTNTKVKSKLEALLTSIDEWADGIESVRQEREEAITALQSLMGWRKLFLPRVVVGFIVDSAVRIIRAVGCPDLHKQDPVPFLTVDGDKK